MTSKEMELSGKRALVCGGSRGIGRAVAFAFAEAGARVTVLAREEEPLRKMVAEMRVPDEGSHSFFEMDLSLPDDVERGARLLVKDPPFHILFLNSTGPRPNLIAQSTRAELDGVYNQHVLAPHLLALALLPGMRRAGYGRIINMMGTSHRSIVKGLGPSVLRAANAAWAKALAHEVGPEGITVNNLLAGPVDGGELSDTIKRVAELEGSDAEAYTEHLRNSNPRRRFARLEEVAQAALFLASAKGDFINGTDLVIDGGSLKNV